MKNILMITSLYPSDDVKIINNTSVCHYFAKEWVKMGYNVRVIFNYNVYPRFFYPILRMLRGYLSNKYGMAIQDEYINKPRRYEMDGVIVDRLPAFKKKPGASFSQKVIEKISNRVDEILIRDNYKPDIIVGHFIHPNLDVIIKLKSKYKVPCAISIHGPETAYSEIDDALFKGVEFVGYRSYPTKWAFEKFYGEHPYFMCPSGVPQEYITEPRCFGNSVSNFIYVGSLIRRKHPCTLIPALSKVYEGNSFSITFVGEGPEKDKIINASKEYHCEDKVTLTGRMPREQVTTHLDKADVFIMVSEIETFGLVYLEAMSRGCIVIASRDEGMDGIIKHGENGFLCKAGDSKELAEIVEYLKTLPQETLNKLSSNSIATAKQYTDYKVAYDYINAISQ